MSCTLSWCGLKATVKRIRLNTQKSKIHVPVTCQWESPSFLLAGFSCSHSKNREMVELRQCSISIQPIRERVISLKHSKLRVETKVAEYTGTDNHYEIRMNSNS